MVCAECLAWKLGANAVFSSRENGMGTSVALCLTMKADRRSFDCSEASLGKGFCLQRRAGPRGSSSTLGNSALRASAYLRDLTKASAA